MQAIELPLFSNTPESHTLLPVNKQITEEQIITPLVEILETTPKAIEATKSVIQSLDELFPEQQHQEKNIKEAKAILGVVAKEFTNAQLRDVVCEIQYLADSWLDDFERQSFNGKTLAELLHEKGGR
jgi:hypothetical protein